MARPKQPDEKRFWAKVAKSDGDGCWIWRGKGRVGWGYGVFTLNEGSVHTTASRAAWLILRGPIPEGLCVLHRCDNPLCVRIDHLFLGTRAENCEDMARKGRAARGTAKPHAKLDEQKVRDIRRRYTEGDSPTKMSREYGIELRALWDVIYRKNWKWVT